ncbi:hypothetical protein KHA96_17095 [Bacillus sp. FJAT-49711]|uniref:hypothetical protein n=1 Tax=Bacillus sp. FJAT-49711 TaxID=2833585 RepID=UPI001BC9BEF4|nr:hypothetical protein [Bacillus sp. FJAT-49711]MBS4220031.1 hypothetical protein [Bacillus sp. FJAT-49711]
MNMDIFLVILRILYVLIFFVAVFISLKFEMGEEHKDERGQSISNKSYGIVFPLMPLGWFLIELYDQFITQLDYETYKLVIWFLISGLMILHASIISVLKRKY